MKKILFLTGVITLLTTTGCIFPGGERHERARYERHEEIRVDAPVVAVRVPEVEVRPPEIIVR